MSDDAAGGREAGHAPGHDALALAVGAVALVLLVLAPWLVDRSGPDPFYKGPLIFPMIALAVTAAGALPSAWRAVRVGRGPWLHVDGNGFPRRAAGLFVLMCLFPAAIGAVGLQPSTFLVVLAGLTLVGRSLLQAAVIAAVMTLAIHLAFRSFLDIWFPEPWLLALTGL